jgi:hypothetical protein
MKIALIITADGEATFALTPENAAEKAMIDLVAPEGEARFQVTRGQLYQTRANTLTITTPGYTGAVADTAFFRPIKDEGLPK